MVVVCVFMIIPLGTWLKGYYDWLHVYVCICHCVFFVRSSLVFRLNFVGLLNVQTVLCLYNATFDVDIYGMKIIDVFLG